MLHVQRYIVLCNFNTAPFYLLFIIFIYRYYESYVLLLLLLGVLKCRWFIIDAADDRLKILAGCLTDEVSYNISSLQNNCIFDCLIS